MLSHHSAAKPFGFTERKSNAIFHSQGIRRKQNKTESKIEQASQSQEQKFSIVNLGTKLPLFAPTIFIRKVRQNSSSDTNEDHPTPLRGTERRLAQNTRSNWLVFHITYRISPKYNPIQADRQLVAPFAWHGSGVVLRHQRRRAFLDYEQFTEWV